MKTKHLSLLIVTGALAGMHARAATPVISDPITTSLGIVKGADPGEGLDLDGTFPYALSFGADPALDLKIRDATFKGLIDAEVSGASLLAGNRIENWYPINYGDSPDDDNLERATSSIRWSAATGDPSAVTLTLSENIKAGTVYKLQLIFGEQCCNRGFDVLVNGTLIVKDFNPGVQHGGINNGSQSALITYTFQSTSTTLEVVLDGTTASPDYVDHNAIFNAITVEEAGTCTDCDSDGLLDTWEQQYFTNLSQAAAGDPDGDGLTNLEELTGQADPTKSDTDGDGLADGIEVKTTKTSPGKPDTDSDGLTDADEVNTHKSDPLKADTDGDLGSDGYEVNIAKTDPLKADTDGDGVNDYDEVRLLSDPTKADSKPRNIAISLFTGADPGEGLDLQGTFPYAIDHATPETVVGAQIGDAVFASETADGVTVNPGNKTALWNGNIVYGESEGDLALAEIMSSISWADWLRAVSDVQINLANLEVGATYKLQLLFAEQQWPRGFDVYVDGALVVDDFSPAFYQGGGLPLVLPSPDDKGVVITRTFVARKSELTVVVDGKTVTTPQFTDHNAIINALTLERVAAQADSDGDSLPDAWENEYFGNLAQTSSQDPDGDSVTNATEFADGTNPNAADTDGDGLSDSQEKTAGSNPRQADSDSDGLGDAAEVNTHKSNPLNADTDSDGVSDATEVANGRDPNKSESGAIVSSFTGGDPGEGLDLQGNFTYAFSVGTENPAGQVGDANFTGQTVDGVTILQAPSPIEEYYTADYGETPNDDALELAVKSIRHGGGGARIQLGNLVPGSLYKLQLMFGEGGGTRGFDVLVDGKLIADEFGPYRVQRGIANPGRTAVITYSFVPKTNTVEVLTQGGTVTTAAFTDRNPIINAVTLEEVVKNTDSDGDGLSDAWETLYFGNLTSSNGTADPDGDGLNNAGEFGFGSDPNAADADGDGLNDNAEKTAGTNPGARDTDGDGLTDADEVNTHHSNPVAVDPDRDGLPDNVEIANGSNPNVADTGGHVGGFTGGDPGEGLDLDGKFIYAFSILPDTAAIGKVRDAVFTSENVEGVSVSQATSQIPNWYVPEFGSSPDDDALEIVVQNIRHGGGGATIALSNLVVGTTYKLQMLFGEACCNRGMDIFVDGKLVADEFAPYELQGGINNLAQAAVFSYEFVAGTNRLVIQTKGTLTTPRYTDTNPIINAVTLEEIGVVQNVQPRITNLNLQGGVAVVFDSIAGRNYTLEYKASLTDATWETVGNVAATGASTTLRDDNAAHRSGPTGFWRIRTQ